MKYKTIYIATPDHCEAGGVESLYQLADAINNLGGTAITLFDDPHNNPIPQKYEHYNIHYSGIVDDHRSNLVIYPEVWTERLSTFDNIHKAVWWLSVNNNHGKFQDFSNKEVIHFYQSFYALDYLQKNGAEKYLGLFDYLPPKYLESTYSVDQKQDIACYNPAKGVEITNQIRSANPDIQFIPIVGMCENEVIELLKISKVYIDFGHHPGRDRIPRESAILGNCLLTNKKGSAGFYNDLPIDGPYKIDSTDRIGSTIRDCFNNFQSRHEDFTIYRNSIKHQKEQLYNQTNQYFI